MCDLCYFRLAALMAHFPCIILSQVRNRTNLKCSKILNTNLSARKVNVGNQGCNLQYDCQISKQGRPWSHCFFRSSLIKVLPICYSDKHIVNYSLDTVNILKF